MCISYTQTAIFHRLIIFLLLYYRSIAVSDISYYLNAHHIDFHEWCVGESARPVTVTATASTGVANSILHSTKCDDTITLAVQWENLTPTSSPSSPDPDHQSANVASTGTAVYTSSWIGE